jgi:hypothetical protein
MLQTGLGPQTGHQVDVLSNKLFFCLFLGTHNMRFWLFGKVKSATDFGGRAQKRLNGSVVRPCKRKKKITCRKFVLEQGASGGCFVQQSDCCFFFRVPF